MLHAAELSGEANTIALTAINTVVGEFTLFHVLPYPTVLPVVVSFNSKNVWMMSRSVKSLHSPERRVS